MASAILDAPSTVSLPVMNALAYESDIRASQRAQRPWLPKRIVFTPSALQQSFGQQMHARISALGLPITVLSSDRLTNLRGKDDRQTYRLAKSTLAVVNAPAGQFNLSPIPPSADWQFHLAQGCPAHCQYCYLAGSLAGPPIVRAYANLPDMLANLIRYEGQTNGKSGRSITPTVRAATMDVPHLKSAATPIHWHWSI